MTMRTKTHFQRYFCIYCILLGESASVINKYTTHYI